MDLAAPVSHYTEGQLLGLIAPLLPAGPHTTLGPGDDSAELEIPANKLLISCDVLVEGVHFRTDWSTAQQVGARAVAQNLADIAAMGAEPSAVVVGLVLPKDTQTRWVADFARGLGEACAAHNVGVVGGDLTSGPVLMVSVTVFGPTPPAGAVLRSGAQPGDVVAYAGNRGHGAAGFALLESGNAHLAPELVDNFLVPKPPLSAGPQAAAAGATALMDVSDGLIIDAARIAEASGVQIQLSDPAQVFPAELAALSAIAAEVRAADPAATARQWLLSGGEDHGFLATFPPKTELPAQFRAIGVVGQIRENQPEPVLVDGQVPSVTGWDHFRQ